MSLMREGIIYVGNKPLGSYLQACYIEQQKGTKQLKLVARGLPILTAVNVASILQRNNSRITDIQIGCEKKPNYPGFVSTIKISIEI